MSPTLSTRRQALQLPKRRKHIALSGLVLLLGLGLPIAAVMMAGNPNDAVAGGSVAIAPLPEVEAPSPLANERLYTPDLLAGEVPDGVNPTETIVAAAQTDALGNPIQDNKPTPKIIQIPQGSSTALPPAPISGLTRNSAFGPVPKRGVKTALTAYKRPFTAQSGKRPVSVVIGGLGINRTLTQRAIDDLPPDVTLSFAAHATGLQDWVNAARRAGHEVLIEIPMESADFNPAEPGADRAMQLNVEPRENTRNLEWILSRAQGYAAVTNYNGETFLQRADAAAPFLDTLSATGLGFMTDGAFAAPTLNALTKSVGQPYKAGHGLIDPDPIPQVISARLSALSQSAETGSHPIGVGFAYAETLSEVRDWIATLDAQNLQLAPATAALK